MSAEHVHTHSELDNPDTHHEETDVNLRAIIGFGIGLLGVVIVVHVVVWLLYLLFASQDRTAQAVRQYPMAAQQGVEVPPEPRLQTSPREDLRDLRAEEDAILNGYGWIDRGAGVVRIPITEAMKLVEQQGLPARAAGPNQAAETGPISSGDSNSGQTAGQPDPFGAPR
jgi:hypothetical protein